MPANITLPGGQVVGFGDPGFMIQSGLDQDAVGASYGFYVDQDGNLRRADDPGSGIPIGYVGREFAGQTFATLDEVEQAQPNPDVSLPTPPDTPIDTGGLSPAEIAVLMGGANAIAGGSDDDGGGGGGGSTGGNFPPPPAPTGGPTGGPATINPTGGGTATPPPNMPATPQVDIQAYLRARPDLAENFKNPQWQQWYGTLENYALEDYKANRNGGQQFPKSFYDQFDLALKTPPPTVQPPPTGSTPDRPADDQSFIQWWFSHQNEATPADFTRITRIADGGNPAAIKALTDAGYVDTATPNDTPLEKGILDQALPSLIDDINSDAGRRRLVDELGGQLTESGRSATNLLNRTQGTGSTGPSVNVEAYLRARPDLAQNFQNDPALRQQFGSLMQYAIADFNANRNGSQQFPKQWYDQFAQSAQLGNDFANADQTTAANIEAINVATATQLQALAEATTAMQANLSGDLAQRASALQQQIASLLQNLDQLDATQRAALTKQVTDLQANLDQSIATQRQALQTQIQSLQGAVDAQAVAQRAALTQELAGLTAAQAPMNEARVRAAELQGAAINTGLQSTQDQLRADAAREGFIGGSTMQDAALARSAIDARQQAAMALGGAQLANAADTRDIAVRGATGERSIAEALAQAQRDILGQEASGTAGLTTAGATGRQAIGDFGATGEAGITNNTGVARAGIGAQGANTTFQDKVFGADEQRRIADALASGTASLKGTQAQGVLGARTQGNAAKATYYDNDFARALAAQLAIPGVVGSTVQGLTALGDYGQSGLKRTQGLLDWWKTAPGTPPTPEAVAVQPSTSGTDWAKLGASLFGAASQNWWQTPKAA